MDCKQNVEYFSIFQFFIFSNNEHRFLIGCFNKLVQDSARHVIILQQVNIIILNLMRKMLIILVIKIIMILLMIMFFVTFCSLITLIAMISMLIVFEKLNHLNALNNLKMFFQKSDRSEDHFCFLKNDHFVLKTTNKKQKTKWSF